MSKFTSIIKRHEWIRLLILAVVLISASNLAWFGLRVALNAEHPILVVVSGSMVPTLNAGDIIAVHGSQPEGIMVGTIIVFHSPRDYDTLIVHRVIEKVDYNEGIGFKTKGDFNLFADTWIVPSDYVIGTYIGRVPYIGLVVMKLKEPAGMGFIIFIIAVLLIIELMESRRKRSISSSN
jgi:signal peptidase